jgi:hypothetical protein
MFLFLFLFLFCHHNVKIHQLKNHWVWMKTLDEDSSCGFRLLTCKIINYMNFFSPCASLIKSPHNCVIHPRKPLECCSPIVIGMTCLPIANNRLTITPWWMDGWMDGKWSGNNFLLGSNSLAKPWWLTLVFFPLLPIYKQPSLEAVSR